MHNEQFNEVFRSGGGGTGEGKEKEQVVEDIRNKSSQDPEALQDVLRNPFEYRDESELPSELFGLALDASGESRSASSTLQTLLEVEDVPPS